MVKEKEIKEKIKKKMHEPREIYWKHPFEEKKNIEKVKGWLKTLAPELGDYYDEYWEGMVNILHCERSYKASKRAKKLDNEDIANDQELLEKTYHEKSIKHLKKAKEFFNQGIKKYNQEVSQKMDDLIKDNNKKEEFKTENLKLIKLLLVEDDLEPDEAEEILEIFEAQVKLIDGGFINLTSNIAKNIQELIDIRSNVETNRGRTLNSPFYWWKISTIIGLASWVIIANWQTMFLLALAGIYITPLGIAILIYNAIRFGTWIVSGVDLSQIIHNYAWNALVAVISSGCR